AVVLLHVIEHLDKRDLPELLSLCRSRLAQGGKLVLETPNPQSLYVYARAFYLDPTHSQPVHPVYLEFLWRRVGLDSSVCFWTTQHRNEVALMEVPGAETVAAAFNESVRRVSSLLFAPQNFRMIATR